MTVFHNFGYYGYWWSSTESNTLGAWNRGLYYLDGTAYGYINIKSHGFSVRCLRD